MTASDLETRRDDVAGTPGPGARPAERPSQARPKEAPSIVGVAVRDLTRLTSVALTVAKHGFGPFLLRIPLLRRLFVRPPEGDAALRELSGPLRFAKLLAALGPTYPVMKANGSGASPPRVKPLR